MQTHILAITTTIVSGYGRRAAKAPHIVQEQADTTETLQRMTDATTNQAPPARSDPVAGQSQTRPEKYQANPTTR